MKQISRTWFEDNEIKRLSLSSKERITTFFEIEKKAVTVGYILHKLKIDHKTIKRILDVMVKHKLIEQIETSNYTQYRRKPKCE